MLSIHSLDNMFAIMFTHYMYYMYTILGNVIDWLVWGPPPQTILVYSITDHFFAHPPLNNLFELISIYFQLKSIYFQLISIDFNLIN